MHGNKRKTSTRKTALLDHGHTPINNNSRNNNINRDRTKGSNASIRGHGATRGSGRTIGLYTPVKVYVVRHFWSETTRW
jgi:hypothetical protein